MIPRYEQPEISHYWGDPHKYACLLAAELAVLSALEESGKIPKGNAAIIQAQAKINPGRISEIEKTTQHDIIAFCTSITEQFPTAVGKYFHFGVTSSDIIDSGMMLQIRDCLHTILPQLQKVRQVLLNNIERTKNFLAMGRSHGMYAEPMIFAQKWLQFYGEFSRREQELQAFVAHELTCQFSGAVGNYTVLTPAIEELAAKKLGLTVEPVSTQVLPRDRLAKLLAITSQIASAIEKVAVELRHLQRSEVDELAEGFAPGQKGSSTMPHKKNPISGENLTGIARIIKSHYLIALENNVLWHERDISHSSAERMILPDNLGLTYYGLRRLAHTLENLVFHPEKMEKKVAENPICLSSFYLHYLIEHLEQPREFCYTLVQQAAFNCQEDSTLNFGTALQTLLNCKAQQVPLALPTLDQPQLRNMYQKHFATIYQRTLATYPPPPHGDQQL